MLSFWRHPVLYIRRLLLPTCKTCIHHDSARGTGFCDCKGYRDLYERLEGDELDHTFCSEIRGTRYCRYMERKEPSYEF